MFDEVAEDASIDAAERTPEVDGDACHIELQATEKRNSVVEAKVCPGRSSVLGKFA